MGLELPADDDGDQPEEGWAEFDDDVRKTLPLLVDVLPSNVAVNVQIYVGLSHCPNLVSLDLGQQPYEVLVSLCAVAKRLEHLRIGMSPGQDDWRDEEMEFVLRGLRKLRTVDIYIGETGLRVTREWLIAAVLPENLRVLNFVYRPFVPTPPMLKAPWEDWYAFLGIVG
ncbi:hypothetical protein HDV00_008395 [Rhizophlyctis rosea]|nr:hypothetical protein HDV00_008395 [Rhizophlyctis rosea]